MKTTAVAIITKISMCKYLSGWLIAVSIAVDMLFMRYMSFIIVLYRKRFYWFNAVKVITQESVFFH